MKATLNRHLHERALAIIEMIDTAEVRIKNQQAFGQQMYGAGFSYPINDKRIASHRAAIERLEKAYIETVNRINKAI